MSHEVLERRDHARLVAERSVTLESADSRLPHLRDEVGIFAERFFHSPPARVTYDVHDGRQGLVRTTHPRFLRRHRVQRLDERGVERARKPNGLGEARRPHGGVSVQTLLMKDNRDAKPALLDEETLDGVRQLGHRARVASLFRLVPAAAGIARTSDLAEPMPVRERAARFLEVEGAGRVDERLSLLLPDAHHLSGLLLERHSPEQVRDALLGRQGSVTIWQGRFRGGWLRGELFHVHCHLSVRNGAAGSPSRL